MAAKRRLIDIGANLTDPVFRGIYHGTSFHPNDFEQVLERATRFGVEKIIVTGGSLQESRAALEISRTCGKFHRSAFLPTKRFSYLRKKIRLV